MSRSQLRVILFFLLFVNPLLLSAQVITAGGGIDRTFISCTNGGVKPTPNRIAKFTGAPSKCVTATTTDTTGFLGITVPDAQTAPNSSIQRFGLASCDFDGDTVAGDWVQASTTTGGKCHDAGSSQPSSGDSLGRVLSTNVGVGTYDMLVDVASSSLNGFMVNAWCLAAVGTGNGTVYWLAPGTNFAGATCGGTAGTENPVSFSCTAKNLFVTAALAGGQAASGKVELYKDSAAAGLTCTLGTGTTCNDTTHTVALTTSNKWSLRVTTGQASDGTANIRASFQCQ